MDFQVTISTNGLLFNDSLIDEFKKLKIAKIIISLDGFKESHEYIRGKNTYDKTIINIKSLIGKNIMTSIRMIYYKKSIPRYEEFKDFCKDLGVKSLITAPVTDMGSASKNKELLLSKKGIEKYYRNKRDQSIFPKECNFNIVCKAGKEFLYISSSGDVYPCPLLFGFKLGNIIERSLINIYNSPDKSFNIIKNFSYKNTICEKCPNFSICQGGCRGRAYLSGDVYGKDYFACVAYSKYK